MKRSILKMAIEEEPVLGALNEENFKNYFYTHFF